MRIPDELQAFLDTPLGELTLYGVDERAVNVLEETYGLYVSHLMGVRSEDLSQLRGLGPTRILELRRGLAAKMEEILGHPPIPATPEGSRTVTARSGHGRGGVPTGHGAARKRIWMQDSCRSTRIVRTVRIRG